MSCCTDLINMILFGILFAISFHIELSQAVSCPSGFEVHGEFCYFFSHGVETWTGAFESCKLFGSKLVEIDDAIESNYIANRLTGANWWIGLTDKQVESEWMWATSKLPITGDMFINWAPNEPDGKTTENCVFYANSHWSDAACSRTEFYICETDQIGNEIVG